MDNIIKVELTNGYSIAARQAVLSATPHAMKVELYDDEGVYVQTLAQFFAEGDRKITARLFNGHHDTAKDYSIDILQDSEETDTIYEPVEDESNPTVLTQGDSGEKVKKLQRRLKELGYFGANVGGNYLNFTATAVSEFQRDAGLQIDGECDQVTWDAIFASDAPVREIKEASINDDGDNAAASSEQRYAKEMDWWKSGIQKIFAKGTVATITDVKTRLQWREQRRGGTNHADVQPLTAEDTAKLKKAYGGKWSWNRRAIWVTINGVTYAASMNGMPHGGQSIKNNNFDGHHCIHFTNSRTHCSNKVCPDHKKAIKKAASTPL